jgi:hypothetical protein
MARIDKYDPKDGGFRARLGFAPVAADVGAVIPVDLNGDGHVVRAAANSSAARGVLCLSSLLAEGDPVDVMTDGELVDVTTAQVAGRAAGAAVSVGAAGTVSAAGTGTRVGWFVEDWRLIVRLGRGGA